MLSVFEGVFTPESSHQGPDLELDEIPIILAWSATFWFDTMSLKSALSDFSWSWLDCQHDYGSATRERWQNMEKVYWFSEQILVYFDQTDTTY